jgi:alkylation response protein AidB-like acyl-CoA dehydrogenase
MTDAGAALAAAERIAERVLLPAAATVDTTGSIPRRHLDVLADEGFYALFGPNEYGGLGAGDLTTGYRVVETLASGCLATAFVWLQHHSAVRAVAASEIPPVRAEWLAALCAGKRRAGLALGGLRPGPASVRARAVSGGYIFDGEAPWVTGWGHVDVLHAAARDENDTIVWALIDAEASPSMTVETLDLVAVQATRTVHVRLNGYFVAADRVTGTLPFAEWPSRDAAGLRMNGSLPLGIANRCCRLMDPGPLEGELERCRTRLDAATPATLPEARAAASELAMRAAVTLLVSVGARGVLLHEHAQRLVREAAFLLVFGSRPAIHAALLQRFRRESPEPDLAG